MGIEKVDRTVEKLLDSLGLSAVGAQARLAGSWAEIVGPLLAAKTCPAKLKAGILAVSAVSPAWAQELSLQRTAVIERIDAVLGPGKVRDVRVGVGPVPEDEDRGAGDPVAAPSPGSGTSAAEQEPPEGIDGVADPELREILASLSRKAASRKP